MNSKVFRNLSYGMYILAGTNIYVSGSPYADLMEENMSTGRRISREIKNAIEQNLMDKIIS